MRLVRRTTTIPVPGVYPFNKSIDPLLACTYILLEYVDSVPLHEAWSDRSLVPCPGSARRRVLMEVPVAMHQLGQFFLGQGGPALRRHRALDGALKIRDWYTVLDAMNAHEYDEQALQVCEVGPFVDPRDSFRSGCLPRRLAIQNILVERDDVLRAVTDWNCVATVPRCVGTSAILGWMTRNRDPHCCCAAADATSHCHESFPEELDRYHTWFVAQMKEAGPSGDHSKRSLF
ncbi:MAG: hypothetical protein M1826_007686 [Phylliscum demangeonii]|nr:MAG: hypothetical protein M1826_007686 [Phylliscum demangeonii]